MFANVLEHQTTDYLVVRPWKLVSAKQSLLWAMLARQHIHTLQYISLSLIRLVGKYITW